MSTQFIEEVKQNPNKIFLMDSLGALLSAILYIFVLTNFYNFFGIPIRELYILGFLAVTYAIYSFTCYIKDLIYWQPYTKAIAISNLLHCCLTVGLVIYYYQQITIWGIIYFIGEMIIVIPLAIFEFKTASSESFAD